MSKGETSLHGFIKGTGRELDEERSQRRAAIAVLKARLDKAGIPDLPPEEEQAIRLSVIRSPHLLEDPVEGPQPTVVPTRRRSQKGRI